MSNPRRLAPRLPRTRRGLLLTIAGTVVILMLAGVAVVYVVIFPTSSPAPFALTTSSSSQQTAPPTSAPQLSGRWTVGSGSAAGYRVRERLAFLPAASQAVGRTSAITGSASFAESKQGVMVVHAAFSVDVRTLTSDRSMRDQRIHTIGLQSDQYPNATFALSSPISLPASALAGRTVNVSATGPLTIHGTTRPETIPLALRVSGSQAEAVGSITFPWSTFNMVAPSVGGFVTVTGTATMEFDLHLRHV